LEPIPKAGALVGDFILTEERKNVERSLASKTTYVHNDPFCKLPIELVHCIAEHMEGHELIALRQVSRFVRQATRSSSFWKKLLLREQAWLWGTPFTIKSWESTEKAAGTQHLVDWEKLCIVLEKFTASGIESKGWQMALANRRRIWKACKEIAGVYWKTWPQKDSLWEADRLAERMPFHEGDMDNSHLYDDETASEPEDEEVASER
jgi:hypothetical protein